MNPMRRRLNNLATTTWDTEAGGKSYPHFLSGWGLARSDAIDRRLGLKGLQADWLVTVGSTPLITLHLFCFSLKDYIFII